MKLAWLRPVSKALMSLLLVALSATTSRAQRPLGLDISSYQGASVNWTSISNAGYRFSWVKAGEATAADGYTNPDPDYHGNVSKAKAVGIPVGPYYFAHPDLDAPLTAAASFWGIAGPDILADNKSFCPMLDMEVFNGVTSAASYSDWINIWCSNIVSSAKANSVTTKPAIYFSACKDTYFTSAINIWVNDIANYGSVNGGNDPQTGTPWTSCSSGNPWGGTSWQFWQYESVGSVPSITGNVDLDVFSGTSTTLLTYVNKNPAGTQAPANITLYWDASGHHAVPGGGGSGNWSTNDSTWFYTGTSNYAWNVLGDNPIFAGTSGTVTLASAVKAGTLNFVTGNYTLTGTSQTLTLTNSSAYLTLPAILPETISCIFAGSGYTVGTNGFLILNNAANSMNGPIYLATNSTLQIAVAHAVGFGIFTITVSNGATFYNSDVTSNDSYLAPGLTIYMAPGAGNIKQTPATTLSMLGNIAGPGDFIHLGVSSKMTSLVSNTCTGRALLSQGTFALGSGSSLNNVSAISISPNATFDVSPLGPSWTIGTNTILEANGSATNGTSTATLKGSNNIYLGIQPMMLTYTPTSTNGDATHPALYVSQGTLVLTSSNQITVTNAAANALAPGDYVLVQEQPTNSISGSAISSVIVAGAGLQAGTSATVATVGAQLVMTVASNTSVVVSAVSNSVYSAPVTLTATVTPGLSGGTVQFYDNAVAEGAPVSVVAGTASITVSDLLTGSDVITAYYNAPAGFNDSVTSGINVYVSQAISTNALVSSENPALPGDAVAFTSTVSTLAPSTALPSGVVQFQLDGSPMGSPVTLSNGIAVSAAMTNLSHGYHTNEADFAGDNNIAGSTNWLVELINTAPVVNAASYVRSPDAPLNIAISDLLTHASDADGDTLILASVATVSSNGGTITTNATTITYTQPVSNGNVPDTFIYVVSDSYGATATNSVSITVSGGTTPPPPVMISGIQMNPDGTVQMNFTGAPGSNYLIQAATDLSNPLSWSNLGNITADTNGGFFYMDSSATNFRSHYYRAAQP